MDRLLIGPWVGEFGWELFRWQGYCRYLSKKYTKVVVVCRSGHEYLYSDFASEFVNYDIGMELCCGPSNKKFDINDFKLVEKGIVFDNHIVPNIPSGKIDGEQEFIEYGIINENLSYDIIVHARHFTQYKQKRNLSKEKWKLFLDIFKDKKICCIGRKENSLCFDGVDDKRDISLEDLAHICRNSTMIVGVSSGPMHFATLCKCPQIVLIGEERLRQRYMSE